MYLHYFLLFSKLFTILYGEIYLLIVTIFEKIYTLFLVALLMTLFIIVLFTKFRVPLKT